MTRYIKIQNLGRAEGPARMPQKAYIKMNMMFERLDAISALSNPAINMCPKELAKRKEAQIMRTA